MKNLSLEELQLNATKSRALILKTGKRVGGTHIGGSFSSIDFFVCLFQLLKENGIILNLETQSLEGQAFGLDFQSQFSFVISKGHCYLAMLSALDIIFGSDFCSKYLSKGTELFGHPKQILGSNLFTVSSGSLGQGVTYANGLALSRKLQSVRGLTISLCGDGELNEGAVTEAISFNGHHNLKHAIFIDNNNQMSLDKTSNINNNSDLEVRFSPLVEVCQSINGHDFSQLERTLLNLFQSNSNSTLIDMTTIKGKGVSFMEGESKWHHRRFKLNEYDDAMNELLTKDNS